MSEEKKGIIVFDDSVAEKILSGLDKEIDKEGYIRDKNTKERELTIEGEEILLSEWGGIINSKEYIKNDIFTLMKLSDIGFKI